MNKIKICASILCISFMSVSFVLPFFADENYCLTQVESGSQGYCEEILLEGPGDVTVNWCVGADMGAPNTGNKSKCIGNAMEPY